MDFYEKIIRFKKGKSLNNNDLGYIILMNGDTFRKALSRKSLSDLEIKALDSFIENFDNKQDNLNQEPTGYYLPGVYAAANMEDEMQKQDELNRIPVNIPNWEKNTIFINVSGDSMYPEYCSGDIIGIKETDFDYIVFGFAYVVILMNGDVYVKYIKKGKDDNHLSLESENEFYEPKEIHLSKVKKVYQVKGVITKKSM